MSRVEVMSSVRVNIGEQNDRSHVQRKIYIAAILLSVTVSCAYYALTLLSLFSSQHETSS